MGVHLVVGSMPLHLKIIPNDVATFRCLPLLFFCGKQQTVNNETAATSVKCSFFLNIDSTSDFFFVPRRFFPRVAATHVFIGIGWLF